MWHFVWPDLFYFRAIYFDTIGMLQKAISRWHHVGHAILSAKIQKLQYKAPITIIGLNLAALQH